MRRLLLALCLLASCAAGCKHSSSSSATSHTETQTTTDSTSSETGTQTTVTTTSEAPGKTTTTIEEFQTPPEGGDASDAPTERGSESDGGMAATSGVVSRPSHGPLVRRTVTVTEHGQETSQTRQEATTQAQGATETRAQAKGDTQAQAAESSKPALSCVTLGWLGALILLAVTFAAWRILKP